MRQQHQRRRSSLATSATTMASLAAALASTNGTGRVLAFAPSPRSSVTSGGGAGSSLIRKRRQLSSRNRRIGAPSSTKLQLADLLLSDSLLSASAADGYCGGYCGGYDPLSVLSDESGSGISADDISALSSTSRSLLSSFLGDTTFVGALPTFQHSILGTSRAGQPPVHVQSVYLDYLPTDLLSSATRSATQAVLDTVEDPRVESEIITDMSHVALDLITFCSPTRALLRLSIVCGRCLAIAADWIPDHYLHPEEWAFQLLMLGVSIGLLGKSALPALRALVYDSGSSYGDKRAWSKLFKRYGNLSWVQTRMVLAGGQAQWLELESNEVLVMDRQLNIGTEEEEGKVVIMDGGDGYLYWLQKGEAELLICSGDTCLSKEHAVATAACASSSSEDGGGDQVPLLGELDFARRMQDQAKRVKKAKASSKKKKKKGDSKKKEEAVAADVETVKASTSVKTIDTTIGTTIDTTTSTDAASSSASTTTTPPPTTTKIRAGPSGATLLRLDASRLLKLMADDDALADGIRSIVFAGMEDKLRRVMKDDNNNKIKSNQPSVNNSKDGMQPLYAAYEQQPYEPDF